MAANGIYCATGYNGNGMMLGSFAGIDADTVLACLGRGYALALPRSATFRVARGALHPARHRAGDRPARRTAGPAHGHAPGTVYLSDAALLVLAEPGDPAARESALDEADLAALPVRCRFDMAAGPLSVAQVKTLAAGDLLLARAPLGTIRMGKSPVLGFTLEDDNLLIDTLTETMETDPNDDFDFDDADEFDGPAAASDAAPAGMRAELSALPLRARIVLAQRDLPVAQVRALRAGQHPDPDARGSRLGAGGDRQAHHRPGRTGQCRRRGGRGNTRCSSSNRDQQYGYCCRFLVGLRVLLARPTRGGRAGPRAGASTAATSRPARPRPPPRTGTRRTGPRVASNM